MKVDPEGGLPPGPGEITGAAAEARAGAQLAHGSKVWSAAALCHDICRTEAFHTSWTLLHNIIIIIIIIILIIIISLM
jgi:hypothetical protein